MENKVEVLDKYLALGSIVLVKGNVKKLMIVARGVLAGKEPEKSCLITEQFYILKGLWMKD